MRACCVMSGFSAGFPHTGPPPLLKNDTKGAACAAVSLSILMVGWNGGPTPEGQRSASAKPARRRRQVSASVSGSTRVAARLDMKLVSPTQRGTT